MPPSAPPRSPTRPSWLPPAHSPGLALPQALLSLPLRSSQFDLVVESALFALPIDENEGDPAHLSGAIAPGMIGSPLNQDVTGPHQCLAIVHDGVQFPKQDDC